MSARGQVRQGIPSSAMEESYDFPSATQQHSNQSIPRDVPLRKTVLPTAPVRQQGLDCGIAVAYAEALSRERGRAGRRRPSVAIRAVLTTSSWLCMQSDGMGPSHKGVDDTITH